MPSRYVYHVVPADERWGVRLEGAPLLSYESDDRADAVDRAVAYVRGWGRGGPRGRVVVHAEGGQIETVYTYDQLPAPPSSWRDVVLSGPVVAVGAVALLAAVGYGLSRR